MLLFLIDNKKGRSEALCLRIRENKAVFARGLYNPSQQEFIPDEPEILHSNYIRTDGEPKIELGNKIFDIFESIFKEDQITLGEFTMDQVDNNISNEYENVNNVPEEYQSPVCEDVELTEDLTIELIEKIASNIELLSGESDDDKSVLMINESINLFKVIFPDFEISTSDINALQELRPVLHSKLKSILETSQSLLEEVENDIINCTDMELEAAYKEKALTLNNKIKNIEDLLFVMIPEQEKEQEDNEDNIPLIKLHLHCGSKGWKSVLIPKNHGILSDSEVDQESCSSCNYCSQSHPMIETLKGTFEKLCTLSLMTKDYVQIINEGGISLDFQNPKYGKVINDEPLELNKETESDVSMDADGDIAMIKVANDFLENQQLIWIPGQHGLDIVKDCYGNHDFKCINCDFEKCPHPRICDKEANFPNLCFKQLEAKGYTEIVIDYSKENMAVRFANPKYGFTE